MAPAAYRDLVERKRVFKNELSRQLMNAFKKHLGDEGRACSVYWLGFLYADGSVCVRRNGAEKQLRVFLKGIAGYIAAQETRRG
jgi:hypothetical protein